jgi:hypothetical protein
MENKKFNWHSQLQTGYCTGSERVKLKPRKSHITPRAPTNAIFLK